MAKPMLVTLPFVLLLLDYWPLQRFQEIRPKQNVQAEVVNPAVSDKQKKKSKKKDAEAVKETLEVKKQPVLVTLSPEVRQALKKHKTAASKIVEAAVRQYLKL